jgi:hypothetical protein
MTTGQEIAQLEHELETLRSRYAAMERNGERTRVFLQFIVAPAIIAIIGIVLIRDFVAGLFAATFLIALVLLGWLCRDRRARWIDVGTPGSEYAFGPSEAEKLELWIATRERRLAELKSRNNSN